jgi:IrrE N-terminal-like domain
LTRLITNNDPQGARGWGNFLTKLWGTAFPVEPITIAQEYTRQRFKEEGITNVVVCERELVEGMLVRRAPQKYWTVLYASYPDLPGRERFTVAHELGHYLLHRGQAEEFQCMTADVVDRVLKQRESEANEFASYLLMPIDDFREQVENQAFSLDLLGHCASRYGTTFLASALKWIEFTPRLASLVVARDGFVLWSRSSPSAIAKRLMFRSGRELPSAALIAEAAGDLRPPPRKHSPGVWMPYSEVTEYAVLSDRYELQIAVLLFEPTGDYVHLDEEAVPDLVDRINAFHR